MSDVDLVDQRIELEALQSIFPDLLRITGENSLMFCFPHDLSLSVTLPVNYPSSERPFFNINGLGKEERKDMEKKLEDIYEENKGMPILFNWVTCIEDFIATRSVDIPVLKPLKVPLRKSVFVPEIISGEPFTDRKSTFQAHLVRITSKEEVPSVLAKLLENKKIANASHNMYSWRVKEMKDGREVRSYDCNDDGEASASKGMMEVMEKMDVWGVMVVVSRWYGGILLGSERFRIINSLTRSILKDQNF